MLDGTDFDSGSSRTKRIDRGYLSRLDFLAVDDNEFSTQILLNVLKALGARRIKRAENGMQAVELLKNIPCDICFVDCIMPKMDGIEFTKYMRNDEGSPNHFIPIIMTTSVTEIKNVVAARDAGVTEYLVKPYSVEQMLSRISSIIDNPRNFVRKDDFFGPDRRRTAPTDTNNMSKRQGDRLSLIAAE